MNFKVTIIIFFYISIANGNLPNLLNSADHKCAKCICNTIIDTSKSLRQCSRFSMNIRYWRNASSPRPHDDFSNEFKAFGGCMADDNCIVHTINNYTSRNKNEDCNCDGVFDCQDKFFLHFDKCRDPLSVDLYETRVAIFRKCMNNKSAFTEFCLAEDY